MHLTLRRGERKYLPTFRANTFAVRDDRTLSESYTVVPTRFRVSVRKKKKINKKKIGMARRSEVYLRIYIGVYGTSSYVYIYMYIRLTHRSATSVRCSDLCLVRIPWQMARAEAGKRDKSSDNIRRVRRRRVYTVRIDCIHYIIRSSHSPLSSPSPVVPASLFARAGLASAGENLCLRMDIG